MNGLAENKERRNQTFGTLKQQSRHLAAPELQGGGFDFDSPSRAAGSKPREGCGWTQVPAMEQGRSERWLKKHQLVQDFVNPQGGHFLSEL